MERKDLSLNLPKTIPACLQYIHIRRPSSVRGEGEEQVRIVYALRFCSLTTTSDPSISALVLLPSLQHR
jgi:hypothetical protein